MNMVPQANKANTSVSSLLTTSGWFCSKLLYPLTGMNILIPKGGRSLCLERFHFENERSSKKPHEFKQGNNTLNLFLMRSIWCSCFTLGLRAWEELLHKFLFSIWVISLWIDISWNPAIWFGLLACDLVHLRTYVWNIFFYEHALLRALCVRILSNPLSCFLVELIKTTSSLMIPHTYLQYIKC